MIQQLRKQDWFHADGFPIAVERRDPQRPFGPHTHEFNEIVIITGGRGVHVTGQDSYPLSKGDAFVIGGSLPHDYQQIEDLKLVNILCDFDDLSFQPLDLASLPGYHALFILEPNWRKRHQFKSKLKLSQSDLQFTVNLIDRLDKELQERRTGFRFLATSLFMQLVGHLSRCYARTRNLNSKSLLRIGQTISHLEVNYTDDISLDCLVEMSGMSRRNFLREFECATGSTPISYLIGLRLASAAELLRKTSTSITQIAYQVGFNDSNYFARQFRKRFNMSPREYRRLQA